MTNNPKQTEWREISDALRREYGHPYIGNGESRMDFSRHVYVGRAGALLLKAERQESEIERLRAAVTRQVENIERWQVTSVPADAEESRSIYEQLKAALGA